MLSFQRLDVYQRALEFLDQCDIIIEQLPSGRAHLKDQLDRAATSIVLNVAEGAEAPSAECGDIGLTLSHTRRPG